MDIDRLIVELNDLKYGESTKLDVIIEEAEMLARNIFGENSDYIKIIRNVNFYPLVYPIEEYYYYISWNNGVKRLMHVFLTMKEEQQLFLCDLENKTIEMLMPINKVKVKKKLQVFVSSTYCDLKEERQTAVEAILKSGNIPAGMELFKAGNVSQLKAIKEWIDESDIYLLILGGRYGSIEAKSKLSYTHLEYNYAVKKKKPYFAIVIEEAALKEKIKKYGTDVLELENREKYQRFRKQVLKNISSFYSDKKDIEIAILNTISDLEKKYEFSGWIPGEFLQQYNKMKIENEELKKQRMYY